MIETFLRTIIRVYTPIKAFQERATNWVYSWIPYFMYEVEYNPIHTQSVTKIYDSKHKIPWVKHRFGKLEGYLSFKYWNQDTQEPERMILHTNHIQKALHIDSIEHLWAFSEEGILMLLRKYIEETRSYTMIDVTYGTTNIYKEYRSLVSSLCVPKNITPSILPLFIETEADNSTELIYCTEDVKEICVKPTEYICSI